MKKKATEYGKKMEMEEVYIKAYNKSKEFQLHENTPLPLQNILRLEIGLTRKRQLSIIPSIAELKNEDKLRILQDKLLYYFKYIDLDECYNLVDISNRDLELLYAGKSTEFWEEYKKANRESCKKRKQHYNKLCKERAVLGLKEKITSLIQEKIEYLISH